jgi:hypothetical protein
MIEKELDKLVQTACLSQKCRVCGKPAECGHHLIGRADKMLRYDAVNIMPSCYDCHRLIHDGKIDQWDYCLPEQKEFLEERRKMSYKDFLIFVAKKTEKEYLQQLKLFWKIKNLSPSDKNA